MIVSVIIPTLNEADHIADTLRALRRQHGPMEPIVVDGGSTDGTVDAAASLARVVRGPRGRGPQMNHGAALASGDAFLFLHADTRLPPHGLERIRAALTRPDIEAGIFRLSFDAQSPLLRFYSWCTRWPWIRLAFGDRGLFVRREAFAAVGGFPEWPLFEDLELAARLHARGTFRFLSQAVTTSARRFQQQGPLRQQFRNLYLWLHYLRGTNPERLADWYTYDA
jgi:rSAM/selenodomain-associated transferase 2